MLRNEYNQEVIDALDPRDQELVALIVWDDIPREEVSNLLGISVAVVNKRYQRALRRLEHALSGSDEYGNTTHPIAEEGGVA